MNEVATPKNVQPEPDMVTTMDCDPVVGATKPKSCTARSVPDPAVPPVFAVPNVEALVPPTVTEETVSALAVWFHSTATTM